MSENVIELTDANFENTVQSSEHPMLVEFWAQWCGPCQAVAPVLEELAKDKAGSLSVAKVDVDANPQTAASFQVQSIPTMILFKDGKATDVRILGARRKEQLMSDISAYVP